MIRAFEPWHLIVLAGIAAVLFGAKRLPDNARSLGQSLRIFRAEMDAAAPRTPAPGEPSDHGSQQPTTTPAGQVTN